MHKIYIYTVAQKNLEKKEKVHRKDEIKRALTDHSSRRFRSHHGHQERSWRRIVLSSSAETIKSKSCFPRDSWSWWIFITNCSGGDTIKKRKQDYEGNLQLYTGIQTKVR